MSAEEATSPDAGGVKERNERTERGASEVSPANSPESHASHATPLASPTADDRDDIEHSIPATLIQDPNAERYYDTLFNRQLTPITVFIDNPDLSINWVCQLEEKKEGVLLHRDDKVSFLAPSHGFFNR